MSRPTLVPELYVESLSRSLAFYHDTLGFRIEYQRPENGFAAINLEGGHLMLEEFNSRRKASPDEFASGSWRIAELEFPLGRGINLEFTVSELEPYLNRLADSQIDMLLGPLEKSYRVNDVMLQVRQILLQDPDGYLIRLSQRISESVV